MLAKPQVFERKKHFDKRGFFTEMWNPDWPWGEIGLQPLQENLSKSKLGTFRGMHWQLPPFEQGKLVTVLRGRIVDYVVDLRRSSPDYGKLEEFEIDEDAMSSVWVPPGFAHGFQTTSDDTMVMYQVTKRWSREHERAFSPLSLQSFGLVTEDWILSEKDSQATHFADLFEEDLFD